MTEYETHGGVLIDGEADQELDDAPMGVGAGPGMAIYRMIAPALAALGYDVVRILLSGKQVLTLQIMIERHDGVGLTVDDCAEASRAVSALLDVEDPISGHYTLEVSSPGIDRPLTRRRDFERFRGLEATVELAYAIEGRRRFKGRLAGLAEEGRVAIDTDTETIELPYGVIAKAKLVLNDELLALAGGGSEE